MTRRTSGGWRWSRAAWTVAALLLVLAARYWGWTGGDGGSAQAPAASATPRPTAAGPRTATPTISSTAPVRRTATPARAATATPARPTPARPQRDESGLPLVAAAELPPEARETLRLIERGGPFPYDRDGVTFQNRERLLPRQPAGYYREYTVETPGSPDRGARRIIAGEQGERYYTDDHYASFARVED